MWTAGHRSPPTEESIRPPHRIQVVAKRISQGIGPSPRRARRARVSTSSSTGKGGKRGRENKRKRGNKTSSSSRVTRRTLVQ
eukprot:14550229-Heterocapsa_arctica.AAC.1